MAGVGRKLTWAARKALYKSNDPPSLAVNESRNTHVSIVPLVYYVTDNQKYDLLSKLLLIAENAFLV